MIEYVFYLVIGYFLFRRFILEHFYIEEQGKYVIVTGCDSGFGRLLAIKLLEKRVNVFACCYTQQGIKSISNETAHLKGRLFPILLDITNEESVKAAKSDVTRILDENNAKLWGLVNNAGFFSIFGPDDWCGTNEYMMSLNVNTLGPVRMCHAFLPLIKKSKGRVVTMSSSAGRLHGLYVGPYCTAKYAVEGYMDCLRLEMRAFGVGVHILEPGAFKTELLNQDAQNKRVNKIWSELSNETKNEYGEDYKANFEKSWEAGVNFVANKNIQWVVDCYIHALFSWWPRLRYTPGWDAILLFIPMTLIPTYVQDTLLTWFYSLSPGPVLIPAALKRKSKGVEENLLKVLSIGAQIALIPFMYTFWFLKDMVLTVEKSTVVPPTNHTVAE